MPLFSPQTQLSARTSLDRKYIQKQSSCSTLKESYLTLLITKEVFPLHAFSFQWMSATLSCIVSETRCATFGTHTNDSSLTQKTFSLALLFLLVKSFIVVMICE